MVGGTKCQRLRYLQLQLAASGALSRRDAQPGAQGDAPHAALRSRRGSPVTLIRWAPVATFSVILGGAAPIAAGVAIAGILLTFAGSFTVG